MKKAKTVAEVLTLARTKLFRRGVWMQGTDANDHRIQDGRLCVSMAVYASAPSVWLGIEALSAFRRSTRCRSAAEWNDEPGRTLPEVLDALDKAARAASAPEKSRALRRPPAGQGKGK